MLHEESSKNAEKLSQQRNGAPAFAILICIQNIKLDKYIHKVDCSQDSQAQTLLTNLPEPAYRRVHLANPKEKTK